MTFPDLPEPWKRRLRPRLRTAIVVLVALVAALPLLVLAGLFALPSEPSAIPVAPSPRTLIAAAVAQRDALIWAAVVTGLVLCAIVALALRVLVVPLRALRREAVAVAQGDRAALQRRGPRGTVEVAELAEALQQMAAALDRRASYLEAFAANVSHAIKTPLTAIAATAELLADHDAAMTSAERQRFLANLAQEAERLQRLAGRLLVLARADVLDRRDASAGVAAVAAAVVARHRSRLREAEVQVPAALTVAMPAETLDSLLDNLVDNAVQHGGGPEAAVQIRAFVGASGQLVEVEVTDDGPGLSPLVLCTAFEPFVTTAGARGGTGLGLAIVRTLARAHGGDAILVEGEHATGTCVRLRLPA